MLAGKSSIFHPINLKRLIFTVICFISESNPLCSEDALMELHRACSERNIDQTPDGRRETLWGARIPEREEREHPAGIWDQG